MIWDVLGQKGYSGVQETAMKGAQGVLLVYDATNRLEQAVKAYRTAFELNPSHASALVNLGVHQLRNSQYQEAQATFESIGLTGDFWRLA